MSEWINFVPLPHFVDLKMGETIISSECTGDGIPIFSADKDNEPWAYSSKVKIINRRGAIVIGARGTIGHPRLPDFDKFGATQTTIVATPKNAKIDTVFLYYSLSQVDFSRITAQQAVPMLTVTDLRKVFVASLNPLIQKKIARILKTIDRAIEKNEALIDKYQQIKSGLMQDFFTRGILPNGQLRLPHEKAPELYQETPIGSIPKDWILSPIGHYVYSAEYGISTSLQDEAIGIPVLRMNNIKDNSFDISELKYSNHPDAYRLSLRVRDVLYNRTNSLEHVGKTAIWKRELDACSFASYLVRINLDLNHLLPEFFAHWMSQNMVQNSLRRFATPGVQQVNINPTNLQRVNIGVPKIHEQDSIVSRIDAVDHKIKAEQVHLEKLIKQKSGLMHDLLTGKVPVHVETESEPEAVHV